jgi:uncharacterized protein
MHDGMYIVDGDGHVFDWIDKCYQQYLPAEYRSRSSYWPGWPWDRNQAGQGGQLGRNPSGPADHLVDNDAEGIDLAILYPTFGLYLGEIRETDYQVALCRAYNDWVADYCKTDPERLKAVAMVPVRDPTEACREMNRAVADLGHVGVMFPTFIRGRNVADPFYWPIYGEAEKLGVPIGMHASGSETSDVGRFETFLGVHTWSHVPEQLISVTSLVYGGILEEFKSLRVAFLESGCGWVPFWIEHMQGEWESRRHDAPLCKEGPQHYLTCGRAYYSCEPEEKSIPYVAQWVGEDQLLYASDYPHFDSEWPNTVRIVAGRDDLSASLKRKILGENALRFYGLKAAIPTS